jgi:hypothetical protein
MSMRSVLMAVSILAAGCSGVPAQTPSAPPEGRQAHLGNFLPAAKHICNKPNQPCPDIKVTVTPANCDSAGVDPASCTWTVPNPIEVTAKKVILTWTLPTGFAFCVSTTGEKRGGAYARADNDIEQWGTPIEPGTCQPSYQIFNKRDNLVTIPYMLVVTRTSDQKTIIIDPWIINK